MTTELKPCPFCGGEAKLTKHFKEEMYGLMHRCPAVGPIIFDFGDKAKHIKNWNRRAALAATPDLPAEPNKSQALDGLTGYVAGIIAANERAMLAAAPRAPIAQALSDDQIESVGHRKAWRYAHSKDPNHSSTYTFNRSCLIYFARAIEQAHGIGIKGEVKS